jgi:hypothetical protein
MLKLLIIICCEVVMGNKGNTSYSYEAGYIQDSRTYSITIFTSRKYEVGDTGNFFDSSSKINWSDTMELHNNYIR